MPTMMQLYRTIQQPHQLQRTSRCLFSQHEILNSTGILGRNAVARFISSTPRSLVTKSLSSITSPTIPHDIVHENASSTKASRSNVSRKIKAITELSKMRLSALVVGTTAAGYVGFLASSSAITVSSPIMIALPAACIGTALCSASASSLNQIFEVNRDKLMNRTRDRPLITGELSMEQAKYVAMTTGLVGTGMLALGTNATTAALGLGNILLYAGLYTHSKPKSEWNTWIGAVVGAIPPVMGYTAAGGNIMDLHSILLASTLYLWQFPHFMALSYMHRIDYTRGGFQMVPCNDPQGDRTSMYITRYTILLSTLPILSTVLDVTNPMFAFEGIVLNSYLLYLAKNFHYERTNTNAKKIFMASLWYLPTWLVLFLLHSKSWETVTEEDDGNLEQNRDIRWILSKYVAQINHAGKQICVHEYFNNQDEKCLVHVGKQGVDKVENVVDKVAITGNTLSNQK